MALYVNIKFFNKKIFDAPHGMWEFPGQELNYHHSCDLNHSTDHTRSCWDTRKLLILDFFKELK